MSKSGQSEKEKFTCGHCGRVYSRKLNLKDHSLTRHGWDLDRNRPATPSSFRELEKRTAASGPPKKKGKESKGGKGEQEKDLFGDISDTSVMISSGSEDSDLEPDPEKNVAEGETGKKKEKGKEKAGRAAWTPTPQKPGEMGDPCQRKQLELKKPPCPIKQYLAAKGIHKTPRAAPAASQVSAESAPAISQASGGISALIPGPSLDDPLRKLIPITEHWPDRDRVPTVGDIIAFRQTLPIDTLPSQIGQLAARRYGWDDQTTLSSQRYVQGVVAGYDLGRRVLIDEARALLKESPPDPEAARQRWEWLAEWARSKERPPTPDQTFDD